LQRSRAFVALVAAAVLVVSLAGTTGAITRTDAARRGAGWLAKQQIGNGSFGSSGAQNVGEVLVALVAGGVRGQTIARALNYIEANGEADADRSAFAGRIVSGLVAAGEDPSDFRGTDYEAILSSFYDPATGSWRANEFFGDLEAAIGTLAATGKVPDKAITYIEANECPGGGFGANKRCPQGPDVDTTSWAINVLVAAGEKGSPAVDDARAWLLGHQRSDGGFNFRGNLPTSPDSTGLALSAIEALDEDPLATPWRRADGHNPVRALIKLQDDSGGFKLSKNARPNVVSTKSAVPGLAGFSYPVREGLPPRVKPTPTAKPSKTAAPATSETPERTDEPDPTTTPPPDTSGSRSGGNGSGSAFQRRVARRVQALQDEADATPTVAPGDAESFRRPVTADDASSSGPLSSPLLWSGLAVIAGGVGFGFYRLRSGRP
jgi:prenyltransferase beta subunit